MKYRMIICVLLLGTGLMLMSGCSSIMCGATKDVKIQSNPEGAQFSVISKKGEVVAKGNTPTVLSLKRGRGYFAASDYTIEMTHPNYTKVTQPIQQGVEIGWYGVGNALFGGLVGWLILDPLTGGMWSIKDVYIDMTGEATTSQLYDEQRPLTFLPVRHVPFHNKE